MEIRRNILFGSSILHPDQALRFRDTAMVMMSGRPWARAAAAIILAASATAPELTASKNWPASKTEDSQGRLLAPQRAQDGRSQRTRAANAATRENLARSSVGASRSLHDSNDLL